MAIFQVANAKGCLTGRTVSKAFRSGRLVGMARALPLVIVTLFSISPLLAHHAVAAGAGSETDRLAFASFDGGGVQIFTVNVEGSGLVRLTSPPGDSEIPVWSPDGGRLAFIKTVDRDTQIYVMAADGGGQRPLTASPGVNTFPAWSPDGRRIVFVSDRGGTGSQIYVMNPDGGEQMRLTAPPGESTVPVWSPDGHRIAFVSTRDQGLPELYVMNADGTEPRRLTDPELYVVNAYSQGQQRLVPEGILFRPGILHPAWSPDGTQIAYVTRAGLYEQSIYVVAPNGGGRARIASGYAPAWAPDGRRIAFVRSRHADTQLYVMYTDRSRVLLLAPEGVNLLPAWSPDGQRLAFLASREGGLGVYVMDADGTGQQRLGSATGDLSKLPVLSWKPRPR